MSVRSGRLLATGSVLAASLLTGGAARASAGKPTDMQLGFQDSVTPVADQIHSLHNGLLIVITLITLFVLGLLIYVMLRFNARANPHPSHTHHNTVLEVAWTLLPILILVGIAIPSFKLLYFQYSYPKPDLTIKAIGNQWFWSYEYPDAGLAFDSLMLDDKAIADAKARGMDAPRLLAVDNEIVVPVGKVVHILVTSRDVIHSWTIPSFGSKVDAVPGRVTATWFQAMQKGVYYGQCSELCGRQHAFMPIAVRVVEQPIYDSWVAAWKAGGSDAGDKARGIIEKAALEEAGGVRQAMNVETAAP